MSNRKPKRTRTVFGRIRRAHARSIAVIFLVLIVPTQAFALDSALVRSLLIPGLGQAHQGHYTKASILAGSFILSGFGLIVTQVHYNEAVDKYDYQRSVYQSYVTQLEGGEVVREEDIANTYNDMQGEYDSCEDRLVWRNAFLAAFIATYAVNVIDVLISKPHELDSGEELSVEIDADRFLVTKTFRF